MNRHKIACYGTVDFDKVTDPYEPDEDDSDDRESVAAFRYYYRDVANHTMLHKMMDDLLAIITDRVNPAQSHLNAAVEQIRQITHRAIDVEEPYERPARRRAPDHDSMGPAK